MTQAVEVLPLGVDDVVHIMPIMESAFDPNFHEAWSETQLTEAMGFPGTWLVGARIGDEYVGFAACRTVLYESELLLIAVSSKWRGQHIGDTIIRYIMEKLQKEMVRKLFLEVRINNKAIDFYNRLDFKIIGNRPHYYTSKSGETFNALTMSVDIT